MLITILIAVVILALALYCVQLLPLDAVISRILQIIIVVCAIVYVARIGGLL